MPKMTMAQSEKVEAELKGIRVFSAQKDSTFRYIFLEDPMNPGEPLLGAEATHVLNLDANNKGRKVRCLDGYVQVDSKGNYIVDRSTGKPINDGTCPYCEFRSMYKKLKDVEYDKYIAEHSELDDEEKKKVSQRIYGDAPVQKVSLLRLFCVAKIITDDKAGLTIKLKNGLPVYEIGVVTMTVNQFIKFKAAIAQEDSPAWTELYFNYPDSDSVQSAARELAITPVRETKRTLYMYPELKARLEEEASKVDMDSIVERYSVFRPETIQTVERKLAAKRSSLIKGLSNEQLELIREDLESSKLVADAATLDDVSRVSSEFNFGDDNELPGNVSSIPKEIADMLS